MHRLTRRLFSVLPLVTCCLLPLPSRTAAHAGPGAEGPQPSVRFELKARREGPRAFIPGELRSAECWVKFSADGKRLLTASHDRVSVWDVPEMRPVVEPLPQEPLIKAADLSADGSLFLTADGTGTLRVWAVVGGAAEPRWSTRHEKGFVSASFSPDGRKVLIAPPRRANRHPR